MLCRRHIQPSHRVDGKTRIVPQSPALPHSYYIFWWCRRSFLKYTSLRSADPYSEARGANKMQTKEKESNKNNVACEILSPQGKCMCSTYVHTPATYICANLQPPASGILCAKETSPSWPTILTCSLRVCLFFHIHDHIPCLLRLFNVFNCECQTPPV